MSITMKEIRTIVAEGESMAKVLEKLARLRFESNDEADVRLGTLADRVGDRRERLLEETRWMSEKMVEVSRRLEQKELGYAGISSYGELQSAGPRFDVHCALFVAAYDELNSELGRRESAEQDARYAEVITSLTSNFSFILSVLSTGDKTEKQIAKATTYHVELVRQLVQELMDQHLVNRIGNYVRKNTVYQWACGVREDERQTKEVKL
jgi:hypothetical protein